MVILSIITLSKDDEWETDPNFYDMICKKYDIHPILDVCATPENKKCPKYFTKEYDALQFNWTMTFWMNPPYSEVEKWVRHAYEQHRKWNITGVCLVFAKTDTKWWHDCVEGNAEVHFIKGRLKFWKNGIQSKNSAPYPSCIIIWRKK